MARRDITGAIDFSHLSRMTENDDAVIAEVLDLFCEQVELWSRLLDPHGDAAAWRDGAHTLKGSALGLGAHELGAVCGEAEAGWQAEAEIKAALKHRLEFAIDLALADVAAWRHERLLQSLK